MVFVTKLSVLLLLLLLPKGDVINGVGQVTH